MMRPAENVTVPQSKRANLNFENGSAGGGTSVAGLQRLATEIKEVTGLYNVAMAASSSLNLDEIVQAIYKECGRLFDTANFAIAIYESQTDMLNFVLAFDQGQRVNPHPINCSANHNLATQVLKSQSPLLIEDFLATSPAMNRGKQHQFDQQIRSWLGVPILNPIWPDKVAQGVLVTWSYQHNTFKRESHLLAAVGTQAAIAIRNARLYETVLIERNRVAEAEVQARKALARDLHDGPTQLVSALLMQLDFCKMLLEKDPDRLAEELTKVQELVKKTVADIRALLFELRPLALEVEGLAAAVRTFLKHRQQDVGQTTRLTLKVNPEHLDNPLSRQEKKIETALFAIIQEAVNNALKHAQASDILVQLGETPTQIYAAVTDDGQGFDPDGIMRQSMRQGSFGMLNLRERTALIGGDLKLRSKPKRGTWVLVRVPKAARERQKKRGGTGPLSIPPLKVH